MNEDLSNLLEEYCSYAGMSFYCLLDKDHLEPHAGYWESRPEEPTND